MSPPRNLKEGWLGCNEKVRLSSFLHRPSPFSPHRRSFFTYPLATDQATPNKVDWPPFAELSSPENMKQSYPKTTAGVLNPCKRKRVGEATEAPTNIETWHVRGTPIGSPIDAEFDLSFQTTNGNQNVLEAELCKDIDSPRTHLECQKEQPRVHLAEYMKESLFPGIEGVDNQTNNAMKGKRGQPKNSEMDHNSLQGGQKYMGMLFFGLVNNMFNGMAEAQLTIMKLPVFYKQRDAMFFPSWAYALPTFIARIPISIIESSVWVILTYYTVGLAPSLERFLKQLLLMFNLHQMSLSLFRLVAALGRNLIVTNTFGAFLLLVIFVLGGFIVSRDDIYSWWIWGYWVSPLMYAQNAIAVTKFLASRWNQVGNTLLKARGMFTDEYWFWIGNAVLMAYNVLCNILYTVALAYLNPFGNPQAFIPNDDESSSEKQSSSKEMNKKGIVLPFKPLFMAFDNVNYFVDMPLGRPS